MYYTNSILAIEIGTAIICAALEQQRQIKLHLKACMMNLCAKTDAKGLLKVHKRIKQVKQIGIYRRGNME